MKQLIVFIGAQGSGKTTQARLLSKSLTDTGLRVQTTSLSYSPLFQELFIKLATKISGTHIVKAKFYEDAPARAVPNSNIIEKTFGLAIFFQFVSLVLSQIKLMLLRPSCDILIDHEGYLIKQMTDFKYLADTETWSPSITKEFAACFTQFLFNLIGKQNSLILIYIKSMPEKLKPRYQKRGSYIEPAGFVNFQNVLFEKMLFSSPNLATKNVVAKFDGDQEISSLHQEVVNFFLKHQPC
jgi:deoxyadenosine/deoxycytidine kinase